MSLKYLLDTNILSEPNKKTPDPGVIQKLLQYHNQIATASQVLYELTVGAKLMPDSARKQKVSHYLETVVRATIPVLPYDEAAANWHAEQTIRQQPKGITLPFVDTQIAAVAYANHLIVVTRNVNDFIHLEGVVVTNWFSE